MPYRVEYNHSIQGWIPSTEVIGTFATRQEAEEANSSRLLAAHLRRIVEVPAERWIVEFRGSSGVWRRSRRFDGTYASREQAEQAVECSDINRTNLRAVQLDVPQPPTPTLTLEPIMPTNRAPVPSAAEPTPAPPHPL